MILVEMLFGPKGIRPFPLLLCPPCAFHVCTGATMLVVPLNIRYLHAILTWNSDFPQGYLSSATRSKDDAFLEVNQSRTPLTSPFFTSWTTFELLGTRLYVRNIQFHPPGAFMPDISSILEVIQDGKPRR